ncbi:MAG: prepilin-type N-terminal cleavage/methylation domain-containing protein [Helicobacteraceae bacterium]|nr:prepilin-type N-terminal cleavage/methylation domain-containing protein [Helicobacteraceae bacterium]
MSAKAFTLIELIFVIIIMGAISLVAINVMKKKDSSSQKDISLTNLYTYLQDHRLSNAKISYECIEDSKECGLYSMNKLINKEPNILTKECEIYKFDEYLELQEVKFSSRFTHENIEQIVTFAYEVDQSGGVKQNVVKCGDRFTLLGDYFNTAHEFSSLDLLVEYKETLLNEVLQ